MKNQMKLLFVILLFSANLYGSVEGFASAKNRDIYAEAFNGIFAETNIDRYLVSVENLKKSGEEKNPRVYTLLGMGYYRQAYLKKEWKEQYTKIALENTFAAIKLEENGQKQLSLLATIYADNKNYTKAEEINKKLIKIGKNGDGYYGLARVYNETNKYEAAIEMLKKYIEINPNDDGGYFQLSESYSKTGDSDKSLVHLNKAIELGNKYGSLWIDIYYLKLAMVQKKNQEYKAAIENMNTAIKHSSNTPAYYKIRSELYAIVGEKEKAEKDMKIYKEYKEKVKYK